MAELRAKSYTVDPKLSLFPTSRSDLQISYPDITDTICGAFIFADAPANPQGDCDGARNDHEDNSHALDPDSQLRGTRVLILRRASSLPLSQHPNLWDFPGGRFEVTDPDIFEAVAREVREETGLQVTHFAGFVGISTWTKGESFPGRKWGKLCFIVKVKEMQDGTGTESVPIRCSPSEHQASAWATKEQLSQFQFIDNNSTQDLLQRAFSMSRDPSI
ncbi:NUDIX hydrolase domain-like protein [Aspergillus spectabilis]